MVDDSIRVVKNDGSHESLDLAKTHAAVRWATEGLNVSLSKLETSARINIYDGMSTKEIQDALIIAASELVSVNQPDYAYVAARLLLQRLYKQVAGGIEYPHLQSTIEFGIGEGKFDPRLLNLDFERLDSVIEPARDFQFSYLGLKTLADRYLAKHNRKQDESDLGIFELPQHFWMRVAMGLSLNENPSEQTDWAIEFYRALSRMEVISSTPTLFNSGTNHPQMSSCYLNTVDDSLEGIFGTITECAYLSKYAGGIGTDWTSVRSSGDVIEGTNGRSSGIVPFLKVFNDTALSCNQSGLRAGSFAAYLEPWHPDVYDFIDLKEQAGEERRRAHDIFPALWIPDLFMERVENNDIWSLFSPADCPELHELYGQEFKLAYEKREREGWTKAQVSAFELWQRIIKSLAETGAPWITFKDENNRRNQQDHAGVIHNSNLCVAPETSILTKSGYKSISSLEGGEVEIWNGEEWSTVTVKKTGHSELIRIHVTDGSSIDCTPYHKFYVRYPDCEDIDEKRAYELTTGDGLEAFDLPEGREAEKKTVAYIEETGRVDDTYCFNEPKRHKGVFNGVLAGNCTEISLNTSNEETAVCNLASINLSRVNTRKKLESLTPVAIRMLDNVIDLNYYPSEKAERSNFRNRPVGLGVMGYAEYLAQHGVDWESEDHLKEADQLFEVISFYAQHASADLAIERGPYPTFEGSKWSRGILPIDTAQEGLQEYSIFGYEGWWDLRRKIQRNGIRNCQLLAIAPTATIGNIAGTTPCIEPALDKEYVKENKSGYFRVVDPTVQYQGYHKTAFEIATEWIIRAAATRQKWVDQAQSLNLFKPHGTLGRQLSEWYFLAWRLGLKTTYYLRNQQVTKKGGKEVVNQVKEVSEEDACAIDNGPECNSCE